MSTIRIQAATDVTEKGELSIGFNAAAPNPGGERIWIDLCRSMGMPKGIDPLDFDNLGYVRRMPADMRHYQILLRRTGGDAARGGLFELRWDGPRDWVSVKGKRVSDWRVEPGRNVATFVIDESAAGGNIMLRVTPPVPGDLGTDYPRNFTCIRKLLPDLATPAPEYAEYHAQGEYLMKEFRDMLEKVPAMRFNQWVDGNFSGTREWYDVVTVDGAPWKEKRRTWQDATWNGAIQGHCPWEVVIDMCNRFDIHPWFMFPNQCSDDFYRQAATLVRDTLAPHLVPIFGAQNEPWNWPFGSTKGYPGAALSNQANCDETWPEARQPTPKGRLHVPGGHLLWAAKRATEMSWIVREVFAETGRAVRTEVNTQLPAARSAYGQVLKGSRWRRLEPGNVYTPGYALDPVRHHGTWALDPGVNGGADLLPHQMLDAHSITCYFGNSVVGVNAGHLYEAFDRGGVADVDAAAALMLEKAGAHLEKRLEQAAAWRARIAEEGLMGHGGALLDTYIYETNHHLVPDNAGKGRQQRPPKVETGPDGSLRLTGINGDITYALNGGAPVALPWQGTTFDVPDSAGAEIVVTRPEHSVLWDGEARDLVRVGGVSFYEVFDKAIYAGEVPGAPRSMADLHDRMLDGLKAVGCKNIRCFILMGRPSRYSYWGYYRHYGDRNALADSVEAWSRANPRWWTF